MTSAAESRTGICDDEDGSAIAALTEPLEFRRGRVIPVRRGVIAMPAGLMFSTAFYVSLLFTYRGCFEDEAPAPPP